MLKDHQKKHKQDMIQCTFCESKLPSSRELDSHVNDYHKIKRNNDNVTSHSSKRESIKTYSFREQLSHGPCNDWNRGVCKYEDLCKFAHIEVCRFQEVCRNPDTCHYYHYNRSNLNFLVSSTFRKTFRLNLREFPPLRNSRHYAPRK